MKLIVLILLFGSLSILVVPLLSARILGVIPTPSYSHQSFFHPIWKELSLRGHEVVTLTTNPINDYSLTNLTEIDLHFSYEIWDKLNPVELSQLSLLNAIVNIWKNANVVLDQQLQHPPVVTLINDQSEHFDLVMVEGMFPVMYAFAERFKCPYIVVSSLESRPFNYVAIGNRLHPVLNPDVCFSYVGKLTFVERVISTTASFIVQPLLYGYLFHNQQMLVRKHFGDDYPLLKDLMKNISMLFVNTDLIFYPIKSTPPTVITIGGGMHVKESKVLPKDLKQILDQANEGAIYFSLGSQIKSKDLSQHMRHIILETFKELPYTVLWKYESDHLENKPDNVIVAKWFPQQDILRHSNIKLFITQGGLQSVEEGLHTETPMIGISLYGDQAKNVKMMVSKGMGLAVTFTNFDKELFKKSILEVINNPKYQKKVTELATLAKDQPENGLDRAIWWTEYVIRHKGASHLKSLAADLPFYQYYLLDVIVFYILIVVIVIGAVRQLFKILAKFFSALIDTKKHKIQ